MKVTLNPILQARVDEKLRQGDFENADVLVEQAVTYFLGCEDEEMDETEFAETKAAIDEALAQSGRGEGVSLKAFDRVMRIKHGIPR